MSTEHKIRTISPYERYLMITVGIILMVSGFYFFLIPADLVAGGVTGLGLIVDKVFGFKISIFVFIANTFLLLLGLVVLGKKVFLRSIYGSFLFPLVLFIFEELVPVFDLNDDLFLAIIFGGAMLGIGFGYVIKYGGTSGGTDIPIKILNKKLKLPLSVSVYIVDGVIVALGVIAFFSDYGFNSGLYAILAIYISGRAADLVILGNTSKTAVQIITDKPEVIKEAIYNTVFRGVTEVNIKGGYSKERKTMLVTVITKREYYVVRSIIAKLDPLAFVYVTQATEIQGDFVVREDE